LLQSPQAQRLERDVADFTLAPQAAGGVALEMVVKRWGNGKAQGDDWIRKIGGFGSFRYLGVSEL